MHGTLGESGKIVSYKAPAGQEPFYTVQLTYSYNDLTSTVTIPQSELYESYGPAPTNEAGSSPGREAGAQSKSSLYA